jgi:hypothetical protein
MNKITNFGMIVEDYGLTVETVDNKGNYRFCIKVLLLEEIEV